MPLNIKNAEVERLAAEVAELAGESKTEAIRRALLDRKQRLAIRRTETGKYERLQALLRNRIWPEIPADLRGRPLSKAQREEILGYGPDGV
jgi:antitoxin VapB